FHPYYLVKRPSTQEIFKQSVIHAKSSGIPVMNHRTFFSWWRKRSNIKLKYQLTDACIKFSGEKNFVDIGIVLPEKWNDKKVTGGIILKGTGEMLFSLNCRKIVYQKG
ncbi:MAG TPA: hypothetical protein PLP13_07165, partial [bacterium]|nr:hypothetical protein [bacterium]